MFKKICDAIGKSLVLEIDWLQRLIPHLDSQDVAKINSTIDDIPFEIKQFTLVKALSHCLTRIVIPLTSVQCIVRHEEYPLWIPVASDTGKKVSLLWTMMETDYFYYLVPEFCSLPRYPVNSAAHMSLAISKNRVDWVDALLLHPHIDLKKQSSWEHGLVRECFLQDRAAIYLKLRRIEGYSLEAMKRHLHYSVVHNAPQICSLLVGETFRISPEDKIFDDLLLCLREAIACDRVNVAVHLVEGLARFRLPSSMTFRPCSNEMARVLVGHPDIKHSQLTSSAFHAPPLISHPIVPTSNPPVTRGTVLKMIEATEKFIESGVFPFERKRRIEQRDREAAAVFALMIFYSDEIYRQPHEPDLFAERKRKEEEGKGKEKEKE